MILILFIALILGIIIFLYYRDRKYRQKELESVVSEDVKKILNLPSDDDGFSKTLDRRSKGDSASKEILKGMNED